MTIALREGGVDDLDRVMVVMAGAFDPAFGEAWSRAQCLGILSLPDIWLGLACDGASRVIGFSLSRLLLDEAELLLLAVAPDARGVGIGRALIEQAVSRAAGRGATRLLLEVRDGNAAIGLYGDVGFVQIGRRRDYYRGHGGVLRDALTLARPIDPAA